MNLFDPSRVTIGGYPQIYWQGKPVGAMPRLELYPLPDPTELEVQIMIVTGHNRASYRSATIPANDLGALFDSWRDDPEGTAMEIFHWTYDPTPLTAPAKPAPFGGKPELSIDDLL